MSVLDDVLNVVFFLLQELIDEYKAKSRYTHYDLSIFSDVIENVRLVI